MKDFLNYLPFIIISALIIYFFRWYLIAIAVIGLIVYFHKEVAGLSILVQIIYGVGGIIYLFFTDSGFRTRLFELALFIGGLYLLGYLSEQYEKSKENNETDSATTKLSQVTHGEEIESYQKINPDHNVRNHYYGTNIKNNNSRNETVRQLDEVPTEFYRIEELQSRFEKWLIAVENARAENKWKYGRDYERYVGYLFEREGFSVIYNGATLGSSDGGIDLFCFKSGIVYPIQCKRWKNPVGDEEIYKFAEAVECFKRNRSSYPIPLIYSKVMPLFYSTNGYTADAERTASSKNITCQVQKFDSIREYPAVKCTVLNGRKIYYLPFDKGFDSVHVGVYRGGCYKFSVLKAEQAGFHYYKGLPLAEKEYWKDKKNYLPVCCHSGYWEYVELKSCKIIYQNANECSFSVKFIGVMNNTPPKVIRTGETMFRQRKSNDNLPEFYDDKEKLWVTLSKSRRMLQSECMVEYHNTVRPFKNNMFRIAYRQLFKCEYIDPR